MSSSDLQIINSDCIIIGGGITGLIIATILQRRGIKVTVLDKGQEIGGRMATTTFSHDDSTIGVFDYGTQYLSVTDPQFQVWVDDWLEHNVIKKWEVNPNEAQAEPCYCGVNGMVGIPKYLRKNLDVHTNTKVIEFSYTKKWMVETESKQKYCGDMLIMTAPIPQSLSLLDASLIPFPLDIRFALEQVQYTSCITVLVLLDKPSNIPQPGGIAVKSDSLAWLADNHHKGISPNGYAVTLHSTPEFSDMYWDSDDAEIVYKLVTAAADYLDSTVIKYQIHRWRYYLPNSVYSQSYLMLSELPLIMAGSAFVAPTLEGGAISGMAAGNFIGQMFRGSK